MMRNVSYICHALRTQSGPCYKTIRPDSAFWFLLLQRFRLEMDNIYFSWLQDIPENVDLIRKRQNGIKIH